MMLRKTGVEIRKLHFERARVNVPNSALIKKAARESEGGEQQ